MSKRLSTKMRVQAQSWRDVLSVHPAADLFPMLSRDELLALGEDIKAHGLKTPIVLWAAGDNETHDEYQLLDGRNRLDAMELAGLTTIEKNKDGKYQLCSCLGDSSRLQSGGSPVIHLQEFSKRFSLSGGGLGKPRRERDVDPYAYVLSVNIARRHLTAEQKRDLIVVLLKAQPEKSNRQIAKEVGVSHPHIAKVRREAEETGDVETVTTSIDTKGRKQPAKRKLAEVTFAAPCDRRKRVFVQETFDSPQAAHAPAKSGVAKSDLKALRESWLKLYAQISAGNLTQLRDALEIHRDNINRILVGMSGAQ